jgi:hypothetical protein
MGLDICNKKSWNVWKDPKFFEIHLILIYITPKNLLIVQYKQFISIQKTFKIFGPWFHKWNILFTILQDAKIKQFRSLCVIH